MINQRLFIDIVDSYDGINIHFEAADGSRKFLELDSYNKKDDKYEKFIKALDYNPGRQFGTSHTFNVTIDVIKYDFTLFLQLVERLKVIFDQLKIIGWETIEFDFKGFPIKGFRRGSFIMGAHFQYNKDLLI